MGETTHIPEILKNILDQNLLYSKVFMFAQAAVASNPCSSQ